LNASNYTMSVSARKAVIDLKSENGGVNEQEKDKCRVPRQQVHAAGGRESITRHGLPAATTFSGTSLVTTEQAPMMARAPMVTPGRTNARAPTNASAPIVIRPATSGISGRLKSCVPALR